jgi:DNA-binding beta-propeller fold protein YncE
MRTPLRVLAVALLAAVVLVGPARGDGGPSPGITLAGEGIADSHGTSYVAQPAGNHSYLVVRNRTGRVLRTRTFDAIYGLPRVTYGNDIGGLSRDGRTLVVAQPEVGAGLAAETRLLVLDTKTLRTRRMIDLTGDFSFDALSPDARTVFLIEHNSVKNYERYRVRAYDLAHGRLLPNAIVDRTEPSMSGSPVARVVAPGGTWVYTLYSHFNGEPFVHALDTVHASARCLDIDWHGNQNLLWSARLTLGDGKLSVTTKAGNRIAELELEPQKSSSFGVGLPSGISALVLAATALVLWRRHERRQGASGARSL